MNLLIISFTKSRKQRKKRCIVWTNITLGVQIIELMISSYQLVEQSKINNKNISFTVKKKMEYLP